ncbi:hypothetical protein PCASD_07879 [Puccinia coronata f. sp. avenae]|uniref:Matrin-type domain-containing protein n=1 Tax=Puccinia coronata f. sp. avenae TaxID=200324 RepID=A0A2N5UQI0_9BASI|nr:hypothetical protein PCASD_07879 [Puccinia coronata f. sp. avenae]
MTEYWVSKQSYFCKYCDIYIRDDKPSRAQHENGLRHKGNLERYIRDIYKKEEREKRERADEASQVSKIEKAARLAHEQQDLKSVGEEKEEKKEEGDGEDEPRKRSRYEKQDWKGAENLQNYSDARSLGLVADAELEAAARAKEEEEDKEARSKEGVMGKWEAVAKIQPRTHPGSSRSQQQQPAITREKITAQLTTDRDPDKKPIRKLFTEKQLDTAAADDLEALESMQVKVKVDRRAQALKTEDDSASLHGAILPIRLDGLHSHHPSANTTQETDPLKIDGDQEEEDIKPTLDELKPHPPADAPPVFFKKRKATQAQPRQRP